MTVANPRHILFFSMMILLIFQAISCASGKPQEYTFQVPITTEQESNNVELQLIEVKHNDTVTLIITADESGTLHLHGYDLEKTVSPDSENQLSFEAYATGRFPMTFHPDTKGNHQNHAHEEKAAEHAPDGEEADVSLGYLEVYPR